MSALDSSAFDIISDDARNALDGVSEQSGRVFWDTLADAVRNYSNDPQDLFDDMDNLLNEYGDDADRIIKNILVDMSCSEIVSAAHDAAGDEGELEDLLYDVAEFLMANDFNTMVWMVAFYTDNCSSNMQDAFDAFVEMLTSMNLYQLVDEVK